MTSRITRLAQVLVLNAIMTVVVFVVERALRRMIHHGDTAAFRPASQRRERTRIELH